MKFSKKKKKKMAQKFELYQIDKHASKCNAADTFLTWSNDIFEFKYYSKPPYLAVKLINAFTANFYI